MLAAGFIDEVKTLRQRGDLHADLPSMRCVGYRQAWEALEALDALKTTAAGGTVAATTADETVTPAATNTAAASSGSKARKPHGKPAPTALSELRDKGIFATRQLAKRQITWLRSMPQRDVVACDAPDALAQVLARVQAHIDTSAKAAT
jgi:tRNA dimethylallyltransferase